MAITHDGIQDSDYTSQLAPGGLFTHPTDISAVDITTIQGHLNDAVGAAGAAKGWAVGDDQAPILTGYSETNNSMYYSGQASTSATSARSDADSASQSSIAATQSANAASASASSAQGFANAAETQASQAETSATNAANSATQAGNSATAALGSANEATNAAGEAATSAASAAADAVETDSDRMAIAADLAEITRLHAEIASDSEEIYQLSLQISQDSEDIAANLAESRTILTQTQADSENTFINKERARAFAEGRGSESGGGYGFNHETRGVITLQSSDFNLLQESGGSIQNWVKVEIPTVDNIGPPFRTLAPFGATQLQRVDGIENYEIVLFKNYERQGTTLPFSSFYSFLFGLDYGAVRVDDSIWNEAPVVGDIIHTFLTDTTTLNANGEADIPDYRSAYFQAARAEHFAEHSMELESRVDTEVMRFGTRDSEFRDDLDTEARLRSNRDTELQTQINTIRDSHGQVRGGEHFRGGYGIGLTRTDSDSDTVNVDTEVIASRAFATSEANRVRNEIVAGAGSAYDTLLEIENILDSDSDLIRQLLNEIDSDSEARTAILTELRARDVQLQSQIDFLDNVDTELRRIDSELSHRDTETNARIDTLITDLQADIDSDANAIRRLDSELAVQAQEDNEIHTRIDSEIAALLSEVRSLQDSDSELFARLQERIDSEGGTGTTFRGLQDTPSSYGTDSEYVRVNAAANGLRYFNPFPVTDNRLTTLNGLRIREFDSTNGAIIFASFTPTRILSVQPGNSINWDQPISGFRISGSNSADFQDEFITDVESFTIGGNTITGFDSENAYASTYQLDATGTYVDTASWNGGAVTATVTGSVRSNRDNVFNADNITFRWNSGDWTNSGSGSIGNLPFDNRRNSFTVTGQVSNTSDFNNISSVSTTTNTGSAGAASRNGRNYTSTITSTDNIYAGVNYTGTWTATFTKPTTVNNSSDRVEIQTTSWTRSYSRQYKTWAILNSSSTPAASFLGSISNNGYSVSEERTDSNTSSWRGRTYTFDNSAGGSSTFGYLIAPSSIDPATSFTNPDLQGAIHSGVTRTEISLGHTGQQVDYYFYRFTVGAGVTLRATVSS